MFSWMSGLQNPLVQNDFNMFLDEWMSVKVLAGCLRPGLCDFRVEVKGRCFRLVSNAIGCLRPAQMPSGVCDR